MPVVATQALDTVRSFATPEHIAFRHRIAGPLVRAVAWIVDVLLRAAALALMAIPLILLGVFAGDGTNLGGGLGLGIGVLLLLWFLADWLFGAVCEWRWRGLTPGKRLCGIRVVAADGQPPAFGPCLLRNVLRFADALPTPATGVVAMVLSGAFQRLGDLAADTLVVYDERPSPVRALPTLEAGAQRLLMLLPAAGLAAIDGETGRAIAAFVAVRRLFPVARRIEMARPLATNLTARFDLPRVMADGAATGGTDPDALLCAVHRALFGGDGAANATAARATRHVERQRRAWSRLETLLAAPQIEPVEFGARYRGACADLALADAYHLPAATGDYLHHLVARAHGSFYRPLRTSWSRLAEIVLVEVPGRLHGDGCLRLALLAFFGVFFASALLSAFRPDIALAALGQDRLDDLREMYSASSDREVNQGLLMGGFYIHNNVGIALSCFASGIFAGVGSLIWLVFNGIVLGCSFGWMVGADAVTRANFFTFVLAHGPFELTGIALAGAAGLRLGLGLIVSRGLPWRDGLRRAAREAVPILAVAAILVACAAPIEAFLSPSRLPWSVKAAVAVLCAAILVLYVVLLGGRAARRAAGGAAP